MNRHERRSAGARHPGGGSARIAELEREVEWQAGRLVVVLSALDVQVRRWRGLMDDASAEDLTDALVEAMSEGLARVEQGYLPPDGTVDLLEEKFLKVVIERHACGECDQCKARERAVREMKESLDS